MPDYILNPNQVALLEAAANSNPVPSPVADDPAHKYGLLLGALDELIAKWERHSDVETQCCLAELREVARIHG